MASSIVKALRNHLDLSNSKLIPPLAATLTNTWYLGLTSFGGPAVHFQIFHKLFVDKLQWIDETTYQETFALCQALPGPGSTKMLYGINFFHGGFLAGILAFLIWSLPGALAAYALGIGVSHINDTLPSPVYALLSGVNGATVGIIALAAVQLAAKAATDQLTLTLVFVGASAGMLYNALWYYPLLMVVGGCTTVLWDLGGQRTWSAFQRRKTRSVNGEEGEHEMGLQSSGASAGAGASGTVTSSGVSTTRRVTSTVNVEEFSHASPEQRVEAHSELTSRTSLPSWKTGAVVAVCFFATFITTMVLRGTLQSPPRPFSLFANLYLAGTIIFGGGPVVIPLLREYVVNEGWVSARDFLLGLAIIQAFPGPNFNFAVYLGTLAVSDTAMNAAAGAVVGYVAIFTPGLALHTATMGGWSMLRKYRAATSAIRGVNAAAVGLVFTAVYRLWQIGFLGAGFQNGSPLGGDPWWVVVVATSFVLGRWFRVSAPVAIVLGAVMGMVWYGVVRH